MGRPKTTRIKKKGTTSKVTKKDTKITKRGRKKKTEVEVEFIGTVECQPQHDELEKAKEANEEEEPEDSEKDQEPVEDKEHEELKENEETADVNEQEEPEEDNGTAGLTLMSRKKSLKVRWN